MKKLNTLLIILFPIITSFSFQNYGLYFKGKEVEKEYRTGLDVTSGGPIAYARSFVIRFDISFREGEDRFGYIFRLKEMKGNHTIDLVAKLNGAPPNMYLIYNHKETRITYTLPDERIYTNRWIPVRVSFDAETNMVVVNVNGVIRSDRIALDPESKFLLFFGVGNLYYLDSDETPPMAIRDLRITTDHKVTYHWPLEKVSGKVVKDVNHKKVAVITNPEWVISHHAHWEKLSSRTFDSAPQMIFDQKNGVFYLVFKTHHMFRYAISNNQYKEIVWTRGFPVWEESHQLIMMNDTLVSYSMNQPLVSKFDFTRKSWSYPKNINTGLPSEWHHNTLIDPTTHEITALCGYGQYTYKNTIQSLDLSIPAWVHLKFSGDTIDPRYLAGFGQSKPSDSIGYLFGGLGNESGNQVEGKKFYYDFYKIDFASHHIQRLWTLPKRPATDFTMVNSLVIDKTDECFYSLVFPQDKYKTYLQLVKGDLDRPKLAFLGDSIPYNFLDIESFANLYYWVAGNKLIALTLYKQGQKVVVNFYSILYPPVHCPTVAERKQITLRKIISMVIVLLLISTVLVLLFLRGKAALSKQKRKDSDHHDIGQDLIHPLEFEFPKVNSIYLFGDFQVFDRKGKDITYMFSPTVKELFLLIFLNTHFREKGIRSHKIQESLWPDKSRGNANNNQGVNIRKLRTVIADISDMDIHYDNSCWTLPLNDSVFCDFSSAIRFMKENNPETDDGKEQLKRILAMLNRGTFLPNIEKEWMDDLKNDITSFMMSYLESQIEILSIRDDADLVLEVANALFKCDKLNEKALKTKCRLLVHVGKYNMALETYEQFVRLFKASYDEEFSVSFKSLIR